MDFLPPKISEYAAAFSSAESELLAQLNRETHLKVLSPRMLSGHLQGRVLSMISHLLQPSYVLEIGTYTGYSAICLSEGLGAEGRLITIDVNEEMQPIIEKYLQKSPKASQIEVIYGDATKVIPTLPAKIDLVFIDADKENYSVYFDLVMDKLRPGGFILADNVLWSGKVTEPVKPSDKATQSIQAFNEKVRDDKRVENVLLPIRDGIMMIRKK